MNEPTRYNHFRKYGRPANPSWWGVVGFAILLSFDAWIIGYLVTGVMRMVRG